MGFIGADDPGGDYHVVRQELALYNPEYCARPHIVALNKMDLEDAAELHREAAQDILDVARRMQVCRLLAVQRLPKCAFFRGMGTSQSAAHSMRGK